MTQNNSACQTTVNTTQVDSYRILLLACWLERKDDRRDPEAWRFRLEDPRSGVRRGCVGVERLAGLLVEQIADNKIVATSSDK